MNTLYLHIGTQKTATTTIQLFLAENDAVLRSKGYTYPIFSELSYPYFGGKRNGLFLGHPYLDEHHKRDYEVEKKYYSRGMELLHDTFRSYPNVILSDERLWLELFFDKGDLMKRIVEDGRVHGYQIKLILYLRRQDKFMESYWNQQVKSTQESRTLTQYASEFRHLNYYSVLKVIGGVAGAENIEVVRFEEVIKGDGIIADFMKRVGLILTDEYQISQPNANLRLSGNAAEIKRVTNQLDLTASDQTYIKERVRMISGSASGRHSRAEFSAEEREDYMKQFRKGNDRLAEQFIGDGKPLFSDDYSGSSDHVGADTEYIDDAIKASAAGDVMLYRRILENETVIKEARKTIKDLEKTVNKLEARLEKQNARIERLRHPLKTLVSKAVGPKQTSVKDDNQ